MCVFFFFLKFGACFSSEFFKFFWGHKQVLNLFTGWAGLSLQELEYVRKNNNNNLVTQKKKIIFFYNYPSFLL